uniref:SET domain-containing protein n=1 Tax=Chromera velia CCMP2878 TaxID=1169474 RepID=A0A0G4FPB2_9ALVE|mmetsp:Transcript_17647/g.35807  ORF Transcript_17647/g.35807 Transcript_17647/m.35807 type:complete len:219 (+) Transcript_17647:154-810(+)|eukprot:Cvel_17966.t1-p1 / transcript=Cvel_17966.t1 / gene=Cvel_17966 / organism=Chromera_velia_CCMP2878 / gene_product=hypothetical protein / transcript_product=hypothetical protein / location=Cvel_scaffold1462:27342-27995(+) / protein_length=218 / sequence_SO=supercontig / SO=protein_coding / is_pseudo=false
MSPGVSLPCESAWGNVPNQGWLLPTEVRASKIPQAGKGRFAKASAPRGSVVMQKRLLPVSSVQCLQDIPTDSTLLFESLEDLQKYLSLMETGTKRSAEEVLDVLAHYTWGRAGLQYVFLNAVSTATNHASSETEGLNIAFDVIGGLGCQSFVVGRALQDIQEGDELLDNYFRHEMPKFFLQFAKEHSIVHARQIVRELFGHEAKVKETHVSECTRLVN